VMFRLVAFLILIALHVKVHPQRFFETPDSLNKKRLTGVSIGIATTWSASMFALHQIWYKHVEKSKFHSFNDGSNWLQMDKVGHVYTSYQISSLTSNLYTWTGLNRTSSTLIGSAIGLGYQTTLELFDASSKEWGFSWWDMGSNFLGSAFYLGQELAFGEQRILLKFSYLPSKYAAYRPSVLGSNFQERLLKDYNGQTYWLSISPFSFFKTESLPKWLCFSFGYSINQKLVGDSDFYIAANGETFSASREMIFSMDIDFSQIPVKKKWVKALLKQLNYIKIPFPAIIYRNGVWYGSSLYF
jgi:hypothetical protein